MENFDCLIIGSGPCGIGAAIKLKEAGVNFGIIESSTPGGKVNIAPRVDNYPGFTKIPGPELAMALFKRLIDAGISLISEEVISLTKENDLFLLKTNENEYLAKSVILATGTKERKLGLAKEDELLGHGLSYCAICDGHFFRNKDIVVIGGGNSALKSVLYLANIAKSVTIVHRRNEFRGNEKLVNEIKALPNTNILTPYVPVEILGDESVKGIKLLNRENEKELAIDCEGFFPLVGQIPNTQFINIDGVKDEWNTVPVDKTNMTNCPGLFAGGDILPRELRQIYLAEHDGMMCAKGVINYLINK